MAREATTYNLVLGTKDDGGTIVVLEDIFSYGDDFKGATGAEIEPVTEDLIRAAMSEKREYLREMCDDIDAHGAQRAQIMAMTKSEYLEYRFETYRDVPREDIAAALGTDVPERYTLSACGRIFPRALEDITLIDSEEVRGAIKAIREVEQD